MKTDPSRLRRHAFEKIYRSRYWDEETLSGSGSTLWSTQHIRKVIPLIFRDYEIRSFVDVACGDFTWMPSLLSKLHNEVRYVGCDIAKSVIDQNRLRYPGFKFLALDFVSDPIPEADLILCREALQHLPVKDIKQSLKNFSESGARYLLATTHLKRFGLRNHLDIRPGRCRDRNLCLPPFGLPNPIALYSEEFGFKDKWLGLWELPFNLRGS